MTVRPFVLLFTLALATACDNGEAGNRDTARGVEAAANRDSTGGESVNLGPEVLADVDSVTARGSVGLTGLAPAAAIAIIQRIEDRLDASNVEPLDVIATDLEKLREALGRQAIDAGEVSPILRRLHERTMAVANDPNLAGAAAPRLTQLGTMLLEAADRLAPRATTGS